ncbi:hypothetical protein ALC62_04174 [Cyphomyrmex costatus]|uniref:THAP-type domain-containing protein n=1 Tax=Cyphomyrmex costatus TaxID=456900 RepID=A0A151IKE8_9HYME|nr:hypothetical protein ALC62_04174 [Cyphomyrmex costatus]
MNTLFSYIFVFRNNFSAFLLSFTNICRKIDTHVAIGGDFIPKKNDLICSAHFVHIDFLERPSASDVRLKNLAVPSVFLEAPTSDTCGCRLMSHIRTNTHAGYSYTHYYTRTSHLFVPIMAETGDPAGFSPFDCF